MPSFFESIIGPSVPFIDPNYGSNLANILVPPASSKTTTEKKGGFWNVLGKVGGFLGDTVGSLLGNKNNTGSLVDLSNWIKLPTVNVEAGSKTQSTFKWVAIGAGILALLLIFRNSRGSRSRRY